MNGMTYPYIEMAALPAVGAALLDVRPAFVFSGDGARILWANVAGAAFFGEPISSLLERRFSNLNPLRRQIARLARQLGTDQARLEMLTAGMGVHFASLTASCRRLNLPGGAAVLAIGASGGQTESLTARAERLADAIGGDDCLVAVIDRSGRVLAASGGFDALKPMEAAIDTLIEAAALAGDRLVKRTLAVRRGEERPAGAARFTADGRDCFLLIVGPAEAVAALPPPIVAAPVAERPPVEAPASAEPPRDSVPPVPEPVASSPAPAAPPPEPTLRFALEVGKDGIVGFVSPALARTVGADNGAIAGKSWADVADVLALDPKGEMAAALAGNRTWSGRVLWPAENGEAIAVDLSLFPFAEGKETGFRGFGIARLTERRPDVRAEPRRLAEVAAAPPQAVVTPPATAEAPPSVLILPPAAHAPDAPAPQPPPVEPVAGAALPVVEPTAPLATGDDLDDVARKSIEEGLRTRPRGRGSETALPTSILPGPSNIVHLPQVARPTPERLTGTEQDAFRRIAETLGVRHAEPPPATDAAAEAEPPARKDGARTPASEIDTRLLDRLPIGLVVFRDRKTLFANRTLLDMTAYDSFAAFAEAGGAEAILPGGSEGLAGGIAENGGRLAVRRRDGDTLPVEVRLHAVSWGAATALMLSISPRRERGGDSEETLVRDLAAAEGRAAELAEILDTATDGVVVIDRAGKIGSMNRASEALFGVEANDYLGRYFTDLLADESHKPALDYLDGLASNGVASVLNDGREVIGRVPQGGLIPLFMTMGRIGQSDKFCAVLRDITHWKNVEEELVASRRAAETANAQKSDFLAKISHEIRTPLNAIIGFSEVMMQERFGPIGNDRYRSYLSDINVSGAHLMSLINDLLDLSKIEAGKLDLSFEAVPVNATIQECVALMQPQANRERIIIRTSLSADVPNVVADPRSFRQILLNLMSNAIKFTRAGGQVIVSSALEPTGEVVVRIRDTGIGMSEKDVETALKPFRQIATAKNTDQRGTGLGLPLTKALVEANRASFAIDSAVDQGTLVRITFPTERVLAG